MGSIVFPAATLTPKLCSRPSTQTSLRMLQRLTHDLTLAHDITLHQDGVHFVAPRRTTEPPALYPSRAVKKTKRSLVDRVVLMFKARKK